MMLQHRTAQHSTLQYSTVLQYRRGQDRKDRTGRTGQDRTVQDSTGQHNTILYTTVVYVVLSRISDFLVSCPEYFQVYRNGVCHSTAAFVIRKTAFVIGKPVRHLKSGAPLGTMHFELKAPCGPSHPAFPRPIACSPRGSRCCTPARPSSGYQDPSVDWPYHWNRSLSNLIRSWGDPATMALWTMRTLTIRSTSMCSCHEGLGACQQMRFPLFHYLSSLYWRRSIFETLIACGYCKCGAAGSNFGSVVGWGIC